LTGDEPLAGVARSGAFAGAEALVAAASLTAAPVLAVVDTDAFATVAAAPVPGGTTAALDTGAALAALSAGVFTVAALPPVVRGADGCSFADAFAGVVELVVVGIGIRSLLSRGRVPDDTPSVGASK
jgi:hypothetical protein